MTQKKDKLIRDEKNKRKSTEASIWKKNRESTWTTVIPKGNIALAYPDVESVVHLLGIKHELHETTRDIKIPGPVAARLVDAGKAFYTREEYDFAMEHPNAFNDKGWLKKALKLMKHTDE